MKENTQVYVGDAINWNCNVLASSTTQITCVTPPRNEAYTSAQQNVVVVGRALVDSACNGSCAFTYNSAAPTVTPTSVSNYINGNNYTITGSGLVNNGVNPKVKVGDTDAVVVAANDTSVQFTFPDLIHGSYPLNVYVDGIGYASPTINATVLATVNNLSNLTGSVSGNIVYFVGSGLVNPSVDPFATVNVWRGTTRQVFDVISYSPQQIGVRLMIGSDSSVYTFNYTYKTRTFAINYTTLNTSTPKVSLTGSTSAAYNASGLTLTFNRTTFISTVPEKVYAYPLNTLNGIFGGDIELPIGGVSTTNSTFTVNASALGAGKYAFKIYTR